MYSIQLNGSLDAYYLYLFRYWGRMSYLKVNGVLIRVEGILMVEMKDAEMLLNTKPINKLKIMYEQNESYAFKDVMISGYDCIKDVRVVTLPSGFT